MKNEIVTCAFEMDDKELTIDGRVHYHTESNFGSDADNNRGSCKVFVDDVTDVTAYNADLDEVPLSEEVLERAREVLTREFLEG